MFPTLSPEEVERFVALGEEGKRLILAGDRAGAAAAFHGQIAICPTNPRPYVSLSVLAASRGLKQEALDFMRDAVLRGFADLGRIERSEAWINLRGDPRFRHLQDAVPLMREIEEAWAGWDAFFVSRAPEAVTAVRRDHNKKRGLLSKMEPALGARQTRLWRRMIDRSEAALLEAYVDGRRDADDLGATVDRLMTLYSGSSVLRWERVPEEVAERLGAIADVALGPLQGSSDRAGALVCRALSRYADRGPEGAIAGDALQEIRSALTEVITKHAGSPFVAPAAEGLVRTEAQAGRLDRAARAFRAFRERYADSPELLAEVRGRLGTLALRAGGLPDFRATDLDGVEVDRDALRGSVTVVDFWATWCKPCVDQFAMLKRIEQRYGDRVKLVGVNLDYTDELSADELRQWIESHGVAGRHVHDGRGWESELVEAFGVREIPFSIVVASDGEVLAVGEHGKDLKKAVVAAVRDSGT